MQPVRRSSRRIVRRNGRWRSLTRWWITLVRGLDLFAQIVSDAISDLAIFSTGSIHHVMQSLVLRPFHPPRGVLGPFGPKVGNGVENEFPGPSGPGVQKVKNRVEKESSGNFNSFSTFLALFRLFFKLFGPRGRKAPGTHFQLHFQLWARRAQELLWGDGRVATLVVKTGLKEAENQKL